MPLGDVLTNAMEGPIVLAIVVFGLAFLAFLAWLGRRP